MKFKRFPQVCLVVVPHRGVAALPLSYTSTVSTTTYVPLLVISICLFSLVVAFLVVKLVYMKHRRMGTIPSAATPNLDEHGHRQGGLFVGCLGSPAWETSLTAKLDDAWRRSSSGYQRYPARPRRSARFNLKSRSSSAATSTTYAASYSDHATDQLVLLPSKAYDSTASTAQRRRASTSDLARYYGGGDFGELHGARRPLALVPGVLNAAGTRRASPSSIRLVDGENEPNPVAFAFLSARPPDGDLVGGGGRSPLMGARDSMQLPRCPAARKCVRTGPAPPLPFLPFQMPGAEVVVVAASRSPTWLRERLLPVRFSGASRGGQVAESDLNENDEVVSSSVESACSFKISDVGPSTSPFLVQEIAPLSVGKAICKSNWDLAVEGPLPRNPFVSDTRLLEDKKRAETRTPSGSSIASKRPLKSCLRQRACSPDSMLTLSMSETSSQTRGA